MISRDFLCILKFSSVHITNTILISRLFQDSFDSFDDIEEMVMATNNLSLSPNSASEANRDSLNVSGEEDELPRCIIVTNVDPSVFDNIDIKVGEGELLPLFLK